MGSDLYSISPDKPSSKSLALNQRIDYLKNNWFGWPQWLVFFAVGAIVIAFEITMHMRMWGEHNSGQTFFTDPELILEVILFGLILPILGGIVIGYMGRTALERDKMARDLELRRSLLERMDDAQDWPDLIELVVSTPGTFTEAENAWLLAQRSGDENFQEIATWKRDRDGSRPSSLPVEPAICEKCALLSLQGNSRITICSHFDAPSDAGNQTRHCLWLTNDEERKSVILFDMPKNQSLKWEQTKVLDDLGDQMAMAIENAGLRYTEKQQLDAARKERLRIARDLHDTLGQNITYLRLKLENLSSAELISDGPQQRKELEGMLLVAEEAYEQMRDTLDELRSTDQKPIGELIRQYAGQAGERSGFKVNFHTLGQPTPLPVRYNRQVLYILREALNNVEKHAYAKNVDITMQWEARRFTLIVHDDGVGYDLEPEGDTDGYGLAIMAERAKVTGAELNIATVPGQGTTVALILPIGAQGMSKTVKN